MGLFHLKGTEEHKITFKSGERVPELESFYVFDSDSVEIHVDKSSEITISSADLQIFSLFIEYVERIKDDLNKQHEKKVVENPFNGLFENESSISKWCDDFSHLTTIDEIEQFANFSDEDEKNLEDLNNQIIDLKSLKFPEKRKSIDQNINDLNNYKLKISSFSKKFNKLQVDINNLIKEYIEKEKLAKQLGSKEFDEGILRTAGSPEWKALLQTAKIIYENEEKLQGGLNNCPLCLQPLGEKEKELFKKYWVFLESKAEEELNSIKEKLMDYVNKLDNLDLPDTSDDNATIRLIKQLNDELTKIIKTHVGKCNEVINKIKENISKHKEFEIVNFNINLDPLDKLIEKFKKEKEELKDPSEQIDQLEKKKVHLEHKKILSKIKSKIIDYLLFLRWDEKFKKVNYPNRSVSAKQREMFDKVFTEEYKRKFIEETKKLNFSIDIITVKTRGKKGETIKELKLEVANNVKPGKVLSEGEQRVCALADFLTEVQMDIQSAGIIFDDPVNSLDHKRKREIAKRLVEFSKEKQVIIFTHDKVFLTYAIEEANERNVSFESHWIKKIGKVFLNSSPRLTSITKIKGKIEDTLAKVKKEEDPAMYEQLLYNCFDWLRSGIEALVEQVLLNKVVRRYEDSIYMRNLAVVPWEQDIANSISSLYGEVNNYITAHNRSDLMRERDISIDDFLQYYEKFLSIYNELQEIITKKIKQFKKERESKSKTFW